MNPSVLVALLLGVAVVGCRGGSASAPSGRQTPAAPDEVYSFCFGEAKAAGDKIEVNGWGPSTEYVRFTNVLDGLGGILLPATDISAADWFGDEYRSLTGDTPWVSGDARTKFDQAMRDCGSRYNSDLAATSSALRPAAEAASKITCVAKAAHDAEARFGTSSLGYTPAYLTYLHDNTDEDDPEGYAITEGEFHDKSGDSPFSQPEATLAFRASAASC